MREGNLSAASKARQPKVCRAFGVSQSVERFYQP